MRPLCLCGGFKMALELYLDLSSQPCRSVFIFAKKNNIPFEFKKISLLDGEQHGEEFKKINMMRQAPAIRDGDFTLSESIAILQYMAQKFCTPDHWYPADLQKRALVNEYLSWQHTAIRPHGIKICFFKLMLPKAFEMEVPQEKVDAAMEDLDTSLNTILDKFLQDKPFIAGEKVSLADLVAIVEIMQPVGMGVDVFSGRPKLAAWRDRVKAAIGVELFDEAHQVIFNGPELIKALDDSKLQAFKSLIMKLS